MPATPIVHRHLVNQSNRFTAVIAAVPEAAINWRPSDPSTNTLAQIVRHVLAYQEFFLTTVLGTSPVRDEAAFAAMHEQSLTNDPITQAALLALLADAHTRMEEQFSRLATLDMEETVIAPSGRAVSRLAILVLAATHAAEHLGHAELTRQMWERYADHG